MTMVVSQMKDFFSRRKPKRKITTDQQAANGSKTNTKHGSSASTAGSDAQPNCWTPANFPTDAIRLLVFGENEHFAKKVLFDSDTVICDDDEKKPPVPLPKVSSSVSPLVEVRKRPPVAVIGGESQQQQPTRRRGPNYRRCGRFTLHPYKPDVEELTKVVFGTMPMAATGDAVKVHCTSEPPQLMMTRVFFGPQSDSRRLVNPPVISENAATTTDGASSDSDSQYSTVRSMDGISGEHPPQKRSIPMDVPDRLYRTCTPMSNSPSSSSRLFGAVPSMTALRKGSLQASTDSFDVDLHASYDLPRSCSMNMFAASPSCTAAAAAALRESPSRASLSRSSRRRLSQATSFSSSSTTDNIAYCCCPSGRHSPSASGKDLLATTCVPMRRRLQMGVAVVFNLGERRKSVPEDGTAETPRPNADELRRFLLSHAHFIDDELVKLQSEIIRARLSRDPERRIELLYKSWTSFRASVCLLHDSPRLAHPMWMRIVSLSNSYADSSFLSKEFCNVLASCLKVYDQKSTNFFLSTLLSAVLTYHLAWVASVAPMEQDDESMFTTNRRKRSREGVINKNNRIRSLIGMASDEETIKQYPYNPFWAQYLDICGAVQYPIVRVKTVIVGADKEAISRMLLVVSYFIRCGDVSIVDNGGGGRGGQLSDDGLNVADMIDRCDDLVAQQHGSDSVDGRLPSNTAISDDIECQLNLIGEDRYASTSTASDSARYESCSTVVSDGSRFESAVEDGGGRCHSSSAWATSLMDETTTPTMSQRSVMAFNFAVDGDISEQQQMRSQSIAGRAPDAALTARRKTVGSRSSAYNDSGQEECVVPPWRNRNPSSDDRPRHYVPPFMRPSRVRSSLNIGKENLTRHDSCGELSRKTSLPEVPGLLRLPPRRGPANRDDSAQSSTRTLVGGSNSFAKVQPLDVVQLTDSPDVDIVVGGCGTIVTTTNNIKTTSDNVYTTSETGIAGQKVEPTSQANNNNGGQEKKQSDAESGYHSSGSASRLQSAASGHATTVPKDTGVPSMKSSNDVTMCSVDSGICDQHFGSNGAVDTKSGAEPCSPRGKKVKKKPSVLQTLFSVEKEDQWAVNCSLRSKRRASADDGSSFAGDRRPSSSCTSLALSMFGGVCDTYCPQLALSGLWMAQGSTERSTDLLLSLLEETRAAAEDSSREEDVCCVTPCSSSASTTSEPVAQTGACDRLDRGGGLLFQQRSDAPEAICIVADVNDWTVKVISSHDRDVTALRCSTVPNPCDSVVTMLDQFSDLRNFGSAPDFLLSHIEDRLSSIFAKSRALAELLACDSAADTGSSSFFDTDRLARLVGCDRSDVRLLLNVAAVHSPHVIANVQSYG